MQSRARLPARESAYMQMETPSANSMAPGSNTNIVAASLEAWCPAANRVLAAQQA